MNDREIIESMDYAKVFNELKKDVRASQLRAMRSVNTELIMLYHRIGTYILNLQKKQGWGSKVIDQLSKDLKSTFPEMKGFSVTNLKYMRLFAAEYTKDEISQQAADQLPWFHIVRIITALKSKEIRKFYITKSVENNWSRNILIDNLKSKLHERQGKAITNFKNRLPKDLAYAAENYLQDPYNWDFLSLHDEAVEREIENSIIKHIERFLIDLGSGFSFVGRQYKLIVSDTAYYIDLLFYHLRLHSYVVVELKAGEFKPEYAGKLNFYLSAVDDLVKQPGDNPSIGLLLCKEKNNIVAEYALKDINKPIGLAEYKLGEAIPKDLKTALPSIEDIEANLKRTLLQDGEKLSTSNVDKLGKNRKYEEN